MRLAVNIVLLWTGLWPVVLEGFSPARFRCRQSAAVVWSTIEEDIMEGAITSTLAEGTEEGNIILSWEADVAEQIRQNLAERGDENSSTYVVGVVGNPGS